MRVLGIWNRPRSNFQKTGSICPDRTQTPRTPPPIPTASSSGSASASVDTDAVFPSQLGVPRDTETLPKNGRPRTRASKDKPPEPGHSQNSKHGGRNIRLAPSDGERGFGSEPSPARRTTSSKSSPGPSTQVTILVPDPKPKSTPKSTRKSAAKPKFARSAATTKSKPNASGKPPEEFVDSNGRGSPPSPSPTPSTRPQVSLVLV